MHLNVLTQCSPSPTFEFMWRDPDDRTGTGYRSFRYWTALAERLEAACIDALFFADVHGIYDVYRRSWAPALRHAVQVPAIDPLLVVPAAAAATSRLGFAVTYSTTYHPPEQCARVFSSLDHLTNGRIAWNVVTSYLESAAKNGLGEFLEHDARYDRADEYMGVVEGLWERTFEPSPQRTPVVYQAGASPRGLAFAARHAEVVFLTLTGPKRGGEQVAELRRLAEEQGRDPAAVKALQGILVTVGQTEAEAERKAKLYTSLTSPESVLTKWCGWMGVDLAAYPEETRLTDVPNEAVRSVLGFLRRVSTEREWTVGDARDFITKLPPPTRTTALYGTPEQVADRMEQWLEQAGIDGFNLLPCPPSGGIDDICDLLVPELQRRGLFRRAYDPAERTLRERYFGAGRSRYAGPRETSGWLVHAQAT
jgi:alkanesulfonate monooxygenase SsuD/methylene tetrahydromethanopterin reductase-like flavin-dependent oxidoreductase (luciferase family)